MFYRNRFERLANYRVASGHTFTKTRAASVFIVSDPGKERIEKDDRERVDLAKEKNQFGANVSDPHVLSASFSFRDKETFSLLQQIFSLREQTIGEKN